MTFNDQTQASDTRSQVVAPGASREVTRLVHARAADAGGRAPGHMALVTTGACERAWAEAMRWIADAIG